MVKNDPHNSKKEEIKIVIKGVFIILLLFLLDFVAIPAYAGIDSDRLREEVAKTIDLRQETQKKEDDWAKKKAELIAKYRSLKKNRDYLIKVRNRTEKLLRAKKAKIEEIKRRMKESARIREELQLYLESVLTQLKDLIGRGLPFLLKERRERISSIEETLSDPEKGAAEKYRRVMEALQIEAEYGRTVEAYQETIDLNGQKVLVDILRVGRLSLFFQTPDGKLVGQYDRIRKGWSLLPSKYCREIEKAIEIARRERTVELTRLPLGRIIVP